MKKRIMNHYSKIIVAILLAATLVFSAMPAYAISGTDEYKSTYGVSYEELFRKYPVWLNNQTIDELYGDIYDAYTGAMNLYSDTDIVISSFLYALGEGAFFLVEEALAEAGIGDTTYEKCLDQVTKDFVRTLMSKSETCSPIIDEVSKNFKHINTAYDISLAKGKEDAIEALKKCCTKMSDKEVKETVDELYSGASDYMEYFGETLEVLKYIVAVIEMHEIELTLIDSLLEQQDDITEPLYEGLARLRDDISADASGYVVEKYLTKSVVELITTTIKALTKKGIEFFGGDMPGTLATLTAKIIVKVFVKLYPSVTADKYLEAVLAGQFVSLTQHNLTLKKMYFIKNYASDEDMADYELRYQAYLAAMDMALSSACVLADAKNSSYEYWDAYYSRQTIRSLGYDVYIRMCLANLQEQIKAGNIAAPSNTPDTGSGEEEEEKDNTATIQSRLAALQNIYKPNVGQAWTDSWGGAIQCYGFVRMIFSKLYGCEMPYSYVNNARYKYTNENNVVLVGQLVGNEVTAGSIKSLMSNARLGDVIQACGKTQHTMMVMSVNDDGIVVYDCNWKMNSGDGNCLIYTHSMSYDYLAQRYSQRGEISENGFSLYRAANYSSVYGDGSNFMYDDSVNFVIEDGVLVKYNGWQSNVVIPDTVTSIGPSAFKGNTYMRTVTIPDGVAEIGNYAFENCTNLFRVNMPDSLLTIGISSFRNCSSLFYVFIPDSVTMIASYAFNNCTSLSSVQLSDSLEYLGYYAFGNCTGLTSIHIPKSLDAGDFAWSGSSSWKSEKEWKGPFFNCTNLKDVTFEEGTTQIAEYLFMGCYGLEEITIPNTVTVIENNAFMQCKNLANVVIPDSVTQIGSSAFQECIALTEISISDSVTQMDNYAFYYCELLEKVELSKNLTGLGACAFGSCDGITEITIPKSLDKGSWSWDSSSSWKSGKEWGGPFYNCTNLKDVTFEEGTTQIAEYLFMGCYGLEEITIPNTVTVIENSAFMQCKNLADVVIPDSVTQIGSSVFQECIALKEADIPDSVTIIDDYAFYYCELLEKVELSKNMTGLGARAFGSCDGITGITIPKSLDKGAWSWSSSSSWKSGKEWSGPFYNCTNLKDVTFEEGTTQIAEYLFMGCYGLEEITIPNTVTVIEQSAFKQCKNLANVVIPDSVTQIDSDAFQECTSLTEITIPNTVTEIRDYVFYGCSALSKVQLPNAITKIPNSAFESCTALTGIIIPDTVKNIGSNAFRYCTGLNAVVIPDSVTDIYSQAFKGATALESVTLGKSINGVPIQMFMDCTALTRVTFGGNETTISSDAFRNCTALDNVVIPDSVTNIYGNAFRNCDSLKNITLGKVIKTISDNCFSDCDSLESIVIPKGVTSIGSNVFVNDTKLTSITIPVTVTSINANAFSYPDKLTIYGCAGSYAETFAKENSIKFVDITEATIGMLLVSDEEDTLRIIRGGTVTPLFEVYPEDTTDVITLTSGDTSIVRIENGNQVYGNKDGTVTVTATATSGMTYDFTVVVRTLSSIAVTETPDKLSYLNGEELDLAGMVITASYTDGKTAPVTGFTVSGFDSEKEGEQTVTISYKEGGYTRTATFKVTVTDTRPKLTGIEIVSFPTKLIYTKGEAFDASGMTVNALYSDGSSKEVGDFKCSGFNALKSGLQTITVTWDSVSVTFKTLTTETEGVTADTGSGSAVYTYTVAAQSVNAGKTIDLTALIPSDLTVSTWTSSGPAASVSDGIVTGVSGGSAIITASNSTGDYIATCSVTVVAVDETAVTVTFTPTDGGEAIVSTEAYIPGANGGTFEHNLPEGEYTIVFSRAGYTKYTITSFIAGTDEIPTDIILYAGDINGDGFINAKDNAMMTSVFGSRASVANSGYIIAADFNADGFINAKDRAMISANFGKRNITV